nr:DUF2887 domain-containing protein [Microcystis viridis]
MKTDSIFYRLFETFPESFFDLLNLPPETVNHYQFWLFGNCYAMDGGYKGWNPYIERRLAIFVNCF